MVEEIIMFGDIEIQKHKFHRYRSPICLEDRDIEILSSDSDEGYAKTKIRIISFLRN